MIRNGKRAAIRPSLPQLEMGGEELEAERHCVWKDIEI
jgi:hypothetical protein